MNVNLQAVTDDLVTLFDQEVGGDDIDMALLAKVRAVMDTLDDSDWYSIAVEYWPANPRGYRGSGQPKKTIADLETFLSWIHDSPIWDDAAPIKPKRAGRRAERKETDQ